MLGAALLGLVVSSSIHAQSSPPARPAPAPPADASRTNRILVLDASGSMWNNVSDPASPRRAELAARFADQFATQLAQESVPRTLGLVRLGYQYPWVGGAYTREKLCSDVEVVVRPGIASQVRDQVASQSGAGRNIADDDYNPKGYTPLKLAIEKAADAAPPEGATLVVVTDLDAKDTHCAYPCANGRPLPELQALLDRRHIRIRYVIAAGLIGAIGERARQFAACFGAEFRLLDDLEAAERIGTEVGLSLIREAPRPPATRGTISVELQEAGAKRVAVPPGSQLEVHRQQSQAAILRAPGQQTADAGRYDSSLSIGSRKWQVRDADIAGDRQTDIVYLVADGILHVSLVDSDFRPVEKASDTVWEISSVMSPSTSPMHVKGSRLNQALPAGRYLIKVYTEAAAAQKEVTVEAGEEQDIQIQVQNY